MEQTFDPTSEPRGLEARNGKHRGNESGKFASKTGSEEMKKFVTDVEDVIKRVANVSDADLARVRTKVQGALSSASNGIAQTTAQLKAQAQDAAKQADDYVHESPWQAVGISAALGALLGVSIGYLASRR
jgi:ElaB/YqjD/DUF883 family membrane-anchored ribosome-binding protein